MTWLNDPLFGVVLTLIIFEASTYLNRRTGWDFLNPLLLTIAAIICILAVFDISLESYQKGGALVTFFIKPATVALAIPLYKNYDMLIKNLKFIFVGVFIGVMVSLGSVLLLAKVLGLPKQMAASLLSKSITTPIGMEVTKYVGGIVPIAIAAIIFTGIFGALIGPPLLRALKIEDKTAIGIALGTASHVIGTAKAISMDEETGAMSAIAIPIAGIMTVLIGPAVFMALYGS